MYIKPYSVDFIKSNKIPVYTNSKCVEIGKDYVLLDKKGKQIKLDCDAVVMATGSKSNTSVEEMVKNLGRELVNTRQGSKKMISLPFSFNPFTVIIILN
jgi:NADH dehydrogenase FAD-containing subunit